MTVIVLLAVLVCASAAPYYNHQQGQHAYYLYQHNNQQLYQHQNNYQQHYQRHHNQQSYHHHYNQKRYNQHDQQYYHHQHSHQPQFPEFNSHDDGNSGKSTDNDFTQLKKTYTELKKETGRPLNYPYEGKIENNMYKIVIFLPGFEKNEISVKVKPGLLVVQADHEAECEQVTSYVDVKILPEFVDVNGAWAYENCWLTIILPLVDKREEKPVTTEVSVTTQHPDYNTVAATTETDQNTIDEEGSGGDDSDEEIRGDQGEHNIITPKEVSPGEQPVETTTYAGPRIVEY